MAIIKCPECGHEVSTAADRCPNCGVSIAGNIKTCLDCGRVMLRNEEVCPSCGTKMKPEAADGKSRNHGAARGNYANTDPYAPADGKKKKGAKGAVIGVVIAVVVVALGVLAYMLFDNARKTKEEQQCYDEVIASNDTSLYTLYLENYPDGVHADEVKAKLKEMVAIINDWNDACVNNSKNSYVAFLSSHQGSMFEQACKDKIDSLDFEEAAFANTEEALQAYVNGHPDGKYVSQAMDLQKNIAVMKVRPGEAAQVRMICSQFFSALESRDEAGISETVAEVMDNFLNKQNATHADVVAFANKVTENRHVTFTINNDYKIHKVAFSTEELGYDVTFSVSGSSAVADGQESPITYYVSARINPQMKISSLGMRRAASESGE